MLIVIQGAQGRRDEHLRWRSARKAKEIQALIEGAHWLDRMSIFGPIGSLCGPKVLIEGAHWLDGMSIFDRRQHFRAPWEPARPKMLIIPRLSIFDRAERLCQLGLGGTRFLDQCDRDRTPAGAHNKPIAAIGAARARAVMGSPAIVDRNLAAVSVDRPNRPASALASCGRLIPIRRATASCETQAARRRSRD